MEYYLFYTDLEYDDANEVDKAEALIAQKAYGQARVLLEPVAGRAPIEYIYCFENPKELFIKFWNLAEYMGYMGMMRNLGEEVEQEIIWLKSAYPKAQYLLGRIDIAKGDWASAAEHLNNALDMEPDHPECLTDLAGVSAQIGEFEEALELCEMALSSRPYLVGPVKQRALTSCYQCLLQLGRTDEANQIKDAVFLTEPNSEVMGNVKAYRKAHADGDIIVPLGMKVDKNIKPLPMKSPYDEPEQLRPRSVKPGAKKPLPAPPTGKPLPAYAQSKSKGDSVQSKKWWEVWRR
ncbi:MAG: tetratricopeptide repeat protein [Phycisphaeraceae bacterium]|nr:tetratricopeptide repeat protein [Phycisphaeraceae bacterium]